jgi:alanyl aminopeptidase
MRYPFEHGSGLFGGIRIALLIAWSQVVNAYGYFREKLAHAGSLQSLTLFAVLPICYSPAAFRKIPERFMRRTWALISALALLLLSSAQADTGGTYRLAEGIEPVFQQITLTLDPGQAEYSGSTSIELTVTRNVDRIEFYQSGLELNSVRLKSSDGVRVLSTESADYGINRASDGQPVGAGDYVLEIDFDGKLSTNALGMYQTHYEGNHYIYTQFEAMQARRAFPLFDEPAFKIPYQLTINAPAGLVVVSNTPVEDSQVSGDHQTVRFARTRPMPSYLIAYAVGPMDATPIKGLSVPGTIYSPKGQGGKAGFAIRHTPPVLKALEDYFGRPYPYRKLDFIAVPDYAFGAMENVGLVTFRAELLLRGDESRGRDAARTISVIAHELAHMWYGNLVTMAWWNDLWLNEAFGTWMAGHVMDSLYPQYQTNLVLPQDQAFTADGRTTSKAIRHDVRDEEEILDGIGLNYSKGDSILNMIEGFIGSEAMQSGIRDYMTRFAWKNASDDDLWSVLGKASGQDIKAVAGKYLSQPGYAIVSFSEQGAISQKRYRNYGQEAPELDWNIPLNVKYKMDDKVQQVSYLLSEKQGAIPAIAEAEWVFPDSGGSGYYRWQTSPEQMLALLEDIDDLSGREKIALLSNSRALLDAGDASVADYFRVLEAVSRDENPVVFLSVLEEVKLIGETIIDQRTLPMFGNYVEEMMTPWFKRIGLETRMDDSEAVIRLRPRLLRTLGQFSDNAGLISEAADLALQYLKQEGDIDSNLAVEALRVTAIHGDDSVAREYLDAYRDSDDANFKTTLLLATYFTDPVAIPRIFEFALSDSVSAGDSLRPIFNLFYINKSHGQLYDLLDENFVAVFEKSPDSRRPFLPQITGGSCDAGNLERTLAFYKDRDDMFKIALAKAEEDSRNCLSLKNRQQKALQNFFAAYRDEDSI